MATRYWVGGTGNWDAATTTHWSDTSGGSGGFSVPGAADNATFDANSGGGTVTITATQSVNVLTHGTFTGTLDFNGQTVSAVNFSSTGSGTRTLTLGSSTINISGTSATAFTTGGATNLTITANTATLNLTGNGGGFTVHNNSNWNGLSVVFTGSGQKDLSGSGTITLANFTRTGAANKTDMTTVTANFTMTGTLTLSGNSAINRLFFRSSAIGTARTITAATVTLSNVDLQDITGAGAGSWDFSARTDIGDCQGNSGITFPAAVTQTATGTASFTWSTHGWTTRVPLPQDNVIVNNSFVAGRTVTMDMPRMGKTVDFSGCTGSPAFATSVDSFCFGSLILKSGMTTSGNFRITFRGRSTYALTTDSVALTHEVAIDAPGGTYSLSNAITLKGIRFGSGTFASNNYTITLNNAFSYFTFDAGTKNIDLGTSIVDFTSNTLQGTPISCSVVAGATCTLSSSTIKFSGTSTATKTCTWGAGSSGFNWGIFDFTVAGATGGCDFAGQASFAKIKFSDATNARTLRFTAGATNATTIRDADGFDYVVGTSGKLMTIDTITAATHYLIHSTDKVSTDYLSIKNSNASGGSGFYAGANSTDVSGNSGWTFTTPPTSFFSIFGDEGMVS